jgi:hypothetical protein
MDPDKAYEELISALFSGLADEAAEHAGNLATWIRKGGYPPFQLHRPQLDYRQLCELRELHARYMRMVRGLVAQLAIDGKAAEAEGQIRSSTYAVTVRRDWYVPGEGEADLAEYRLLLAGGGPAVQIRGTLNHRNEPEDAQLEVQDWGTSWTTFPHNEEAEALLRWAGLFSYL